MQTAEFNELLEILQRHDHEWRGKLDINVEIQANVNITISDATLPLKVDASGVPRTGTNGAAYNGLLLVSGGVPPYKITLDPTNADGTASVLPDGLTLNGDGTITGTPTKSGAFEATIDVTDSALAQVKTRLR